MRASDRLRLACLVGLAVLPYLNALGNGFAFDDRGMIVENPLVQRSDTAFTSFFTEPFNPGALYRPLAFYTYWLDQQTHGAEPFGFHLVNIGLHALATALFFLLCRSLRLGTTVSFVAALVFAVHPIHTEAVSNVIGRSELLSSTAVLGALLCCARARHALAGRRTALRLAAAGLFGIGLLCKESAFVFVPLLLVTTWIEARGSLWSTTRTLLRSSELPLFVAIAVAYLLLRRTFFGAYTLGYDVSWLDNPLVHTSAAVRVGTATVVMVEAIVQLFVPLQLSADYSFNQIPLVDSPFDPRLLLSLAVLALLALLFTRNRILAAGALFFLAAYSLASNFAFPIGTIRGERLLYLPSAGFCIAVGAFATWALRQRRQWAAVALGLLVAAYAGRTWARNPDWDSDIALFKTTIATAPQSAKAHHNLGVALAEEGRYDDASLAFREALQIYPEYDEAAFSIGRMYELRGMMAGALHWYGEALRIDPRHAKSNLNRGVIFYNSGDLEAAEQAFRAGLSFHPDDPRLLTGMGLVRLAEGRGDEAIVVLEQARRIDPDDAETKRALELAQRGTARPMKGS